MKYKSLIKVIFIKITDLKLQNSLYWFVSIDFNFVGDSVIRKIMIKIKYIFYENKIFKIYKLNTQILLIVSLE